MIHIICKRGSDGARDLLKAILALGGKARRERKVPFRTINDGKKAFVIPWGEAYKGPGGVGKVVLNPRMVFNKWEELALLRDGGVKTPPFALRKQGEGWLPRRVNHQGGSDLLHPGHGDYFVQKVPVTSEFRVHIVKGQVIRVGKKKLRPGWVQDGPPGRKAHPWIRSWDAGWRLVYDFPHDSIPPGVRAAAKKSLEALGLDFGAVDVGVGTGGPWVFEVNKAPGLEPKSAAVYAKKFLELSKEAV